MHNYSNFYMHFINSWFNGQTVSCKGDDRSQPKSAVLQTD